MYMFAKHNFLLGMTKRYASDCFIEDIRPLGMQHTSVADIEADTIKVAALGANRHFHLKLSF